MKLLDFYALLEGAPSSLYSIYIKNNFISNSQKLF